MLHSISGFIFFNWIIKGQRLSIYKTGMCSSWNTELWQTMLGRKLGASGEKVFGSEIVGSLRKKSERHLLLKMNPWSKLCALSACSGVPDIWMIFSVASGLSSTSWTFAPDNCSKTRIISQKCKLNLAKGNNREERLELDTPHWSEQACFLILLWVWKLHVGV